MRVQVWDKPNVSPKGMCQCKHQNHSLSLLRVICGTYYCCNLSLSSCFTNKSSLASSSVRFPVLQLAASSLTAKNKKLRLKTSTEEAGDDGRASLPGPDTHPAPSSLPYPQPTLSSSPAPFSPAFRTSSGVPMKHLDSLTRQQYLAALSAKPQATWLRHFGSISNAAPFTTRSVPTSSPASATC